MLVPARRPATVQPTISQPVVAAVQARHSQLGRAHRVRLQEQAPCDQAFFDSLRSSDDIEMSLVARALPRSPSVSCADARHAVRAWQRRCDLQF